MPKKTHGNSKKNKNPHHLYEIVDGKDNDIFKYGISGDPLNDDGSSPRANEQVSLFNTVVNWARFFARVLLTGIAGNKKAREKEDEYLENYRAKHGRFPRGNRDRK